jgi:carbonic anhydrase/acetyltransferase-like protein (isoleucine patch superfamily)
MLKKVICILIKHRKIEPKVDPSVFLAPTAVLIGNVKVEKRSRIMYGSVLDSEGSKIEVGECSIICENAVIRATASGDKDYPVIIGDNVFISPHSTLIGCKVETCCYIATGATVLQGATIHSGAAVAVGALVHANSVVPSNYFIPPNTIAIGDPLTLYSPDEKEQLANAIKSLNFVKTAFNVDAQWEDRYSRYRQVTEIRSIEFEKHFDDELIKS